MCPRSLSLLVVSGGPGGYQLHIKEMIKKIKDSGCSSFGNARCRTRVMSLLAVGLYGSSYKHAGWPLRACSHANLSGSAPQVSGLCSQCLPCILLSKQPRYWQELVVIWDLMSEIFVSDWKDRVCFSNKQKSSRNIFYSELEACTQK